LEAFVFFGFIDRFLRARYSCANRLIADLRENGGLHLLPVDVGQIDFLVSAVNHGRFVHGFSHKNEMLNQMSLSFQRGTRPAVASTSNQSQ
jgi:hypothetical protein